MYIVKNKKSPNYQLVYLRAGKRTSISTGTPSKNEAKKFLASLNPLTISKPKLNKVSIRLKEYVAEYKTYVGNTHSESYLKKAVTSSFNRLQYNVFLSPYNRRGGIFILNRINILHTIHLYGMHKKIFYSRLFRKNVFYRKIQSTGIK